MRCIFCKSDSTGSKTIEHVIPESLGNKDHILPPGTVCDACNNYFGLNVEGPLLDTAYFREARSRNSVPNKRNILPTVHGFILPGVIPVEMIDDFDGHAIFASRENDNGKLMTVMRNDRNCELIVPIAFEPDRRLMSRFLAKAALEVLARFFTVVPGGLDEIIEKPELEEIRQYARLVRFSE